MTIISRPSGVSFSGNLVPFRIMAYLPITFTLSCDGTEVLSQKYVPDSDGMVEIDLRPVVEDLLSFDLRATATAYVQPSIMKTFTAVVDGGSYVFTVIRGGVDNLSDTVANFLSGHFLTWQPNVKGVTYSSPEYLTYYAAVACTVKVKAYFTDSSGQVTSNSTVVLAELTAGSVWTVPVQYAIIAGKFGSLPAYYDVWVESGGTTLNNVQRYFAELPKSTDEDWILFENSLGGIDCFRAYGSVELAYRHEHQTAVSGDEMQEYRVDTEPLMKKNTGVLSKREAMWLLDFFPSLGKYIYTGGSLRRIVVTDSSVSGKLRLEPVSFSFSFRYVDLRPYLNLPAGELPAQMLEITVPDVGSFSLPPRLSEFPRIRPGGGVLIPAQQSWSDSWGVIPWEYIADLITGDCRGIFLRKDMDDETPYNLGVGGTLDAFRVVGRSGIQAGYPYERGVSGAFISAAGRADLESSLIRDYLSSLVFREGFFGEGFKLWNDNGTWKLTVDQLTVRQIMNVYELIINKVRAVGGTLVISPASGKVKSVADDGYNYRITFEEGNDSFAMNDLIRMQRYTGRDVAGGGDGQVVSGYWVEVNGLGTNADGEQWVTVSKRDEGLWSIPAVGDEVVQMGNTANEGRQSLISLSAAEDGVPRIEILGGVDKRNFTSSLRVRLGGLDDITDADFPDDDQPHGDGLYSDNVYLKGRFVMSNGQEVETYFTVQEGLFKSVIGNATASVMTARDNYLANAGFAQSLQKWQVESGVVYFTDNDGSWLFANDGMLSHVTREAEMGDHLGIPTLHIVNGSVTQGNSDMQRHPVPVKNMDNLKEAVPVWLTFMYKVSEAGTLKIAILDEDTTGFASFTPFHVEQVMQVSDEYALASFSGYWSGSGDFCLSFSGDINIYGLYFWSDAELKYATLIEQTEEAIRLEAVARNNMGTELFATWELRAQSIESRVSATESGVSDYTSFKQTAQGFHAEIVAARNGLASLKANIDATAAGAVSTFKADYFDGLATRVGTAESNISQNATDISLKVSTTDYNGDTIIGKINLNSTTATISASRIVLTGAVTFSSFDQSLQATINGKANTADLGTFATRSSLATSDITQAIANAVMSNQNAQTFGSLAALSSVSDSVLTQALRDTIASKVVKGELNATNLGSTLNTAIGLIANANGTSKLGSIAYLSDIANAACNGVTFISGGYINTGLIDVGSIVCTEIAAVRGTVGGVAIHDNYLGTAVSTTTGSSVQIELRPGRMAASGNGRWAIVDCNSTDQYTLMLSSASNDYGALSVTGRAYVNGHTVLTGHIVTSDYTLPANSPIGKIVFNPYGYAFTAPSGEYIISESSSSGTDTVDAAESGFSKFYIKITSNRWKVYNCH